MADIFYPPVGHCIYCGETKLPIGEDRFTDEHIIPLGIGGNLILPEASCTICQRLINNQIETPILQHEWRAFRDRKGFPSRKKKARATRTHIPATRVDGSRLSIPIQDHSTPVPLYRFHEPRLLSKRVIPTLNHHWTMSILASGDEETAMQRKYSDWNKQHEFITRPHLFARMLAKIGYSYTVAEYGAPPAFTPFAPQIILGISEDWTELVGGSLEFPLPIPGGDHVTNISIRGTGPDTGYILVEIRLFSQIVMPLYWVVVGQVDLKNIEHVRAFEKHRLDGKIK